MSVPPTRSDVLHACDVAEDVAIAFGFNNIAEALPATATVGAELPLNALTELLRIDLAAAGFTEVLTWALCSHDENFAHLRREDDGAVRLSNPATVEFQVRPGCCMHGVAHVMWWTCMCIMHADSAAQHGHWRPQHTRTSVGNTATGSSPRQSADCDACNSDNTAHPSHRR